MANPGNHLCLPATTISCRNHNAQEEQKQLLRKIPRCNVAAAWRAECSFSGLNDKLNSGNNHHDTEKAVSPCSPSFLDFFVGIPHKSINLGFPYLEPLQIFPFNTINTQIEVLANDKIRHQIPYWCSCSPRQQQKAETVASKNSC